MTITREFYWCPWPLLRLGQDLSRLTFRAHTCSIPVVKTTYYDLCVNITDLLDPQLIGSRVQIIGASYIPSVEVNGVDNTPLFITLPLFAFLEHVILPGLELNKALSFMPGDPALGPWCCWKRLGFRLLVTRTTLPLP